MHGALVAKFAVKSIFTSHAAVSGRLLLLPGRWTVLAVLTVDGR